MPPVHDSLSVILPILPVQARTSFFLDDGAELYSRTR